ncbi:MAG: FeoA family protein [Dehalococcoidales bacterium]|nr:FeoA family protein [Dehalococcoidales bacterium]
MPVHEIPLTLADTNQTITVSGFRGGFGLQRRLSDMGFTPGARIKVISKEASGPMLIELRGSRLALGRGVAQHILVEITPR